MKMNFLKLTLVMLLSITINAQQKIYQSVSKSSSLRCGGLENVNSDTLIGELNKNWVVNNDKLSIVAIPKQNQSTELLKELIAAGLLNYSVQANGIITGFINLSSVELLENCKYLRSVIPTMSSQTSLGLTTSQAGQAFFSDHISEKLGLTGKGLKIGIISDSYNQRGGALDGVISGDLPGENNPNGFNKEVTVLNDDFSNGVDEGRAMAELIHDIAPDAELYFYSGFNGLLGMAQAVANLSNVGCDIIVDDVYNPNSPVYQNGIVAQIINIINEQGVLYFTAAANLSNTGFEAKYDFELISEGDREIERFKYESGKTERSINVPFGSQLRIDFMWDDFSMYGSLNDIRFPETDLDIFLVDSETREVLASSELSNTDTGLPYEILRYTNLRLNRTAVNAEIVIEKRQGFPSPERIYYSYLTDDIFKVFGNIEPVLEEPAGTISGFRAAKGAITLGAMDYRLSPEFGGTPVVEVFSSYGGGIPIILDNEGNRIKDVEFRNKPELVAPDNLNTSFFGLFDSDNDGFKNFEGTSAAAPVAAALAALMLEVNPELSNEDVRKILIESALDMDDEATEGFDEGFDFASGYGLIQADKAIALATGEAMVYRVEMVDAETKELINIIEENEELDLTDVENNVDLRLATTNVSSLNSVLSGGLDNRFISNTGFQAPFFAVDADNSFNREWSATSGDYNLRWFAFSENGKEDFSNLNFSIINSSFNGLSANSFNLNFDNLSAFPNPANSLSFVRLSIPGSIIQSFEVFDQSGNFILADLGSIVNVGSLKSGVYIIIATDSIGNTHETKIVVE